MIIRHVELVGETTPAREIVISGDVIAHVGDPSAGRSSTGGPRLDLGDAIAFPGLTNSHDHLEYNLYPALGHKRYVDYVEWGLDIHQRDADLISSLEHVPRAHRLRWGALKNLLCGVTTVAHHGDANDGRTAIPIGTVRGTAVHSLRFAPRWRWTLNAPVDRSPYVFHVGEGTARGAREEVDTLLRWNLFARPLVGVHAMTLHREQAGRFRAVVWCPLSNEFLYGATADVASVKDRTAILFGTDSTLTADYNVWNHLRRARAIGALDDRELFEAVTSTASRVWRLAGSGRVVAGQIADLVVARKRAENRWDAFFSVNPEDILLVLRGGKVLLCDASLDAAFVPRPFSMVRLGGSAKWVAEDVPALLTRIRECGVEPNLPITEARR